MMIRNQTAQNGAEPVIKDENDIMTDEDEKIYKEMCDELEQVKNSGIYDDIKKEKLVYVDDDWVVDELNITIMNRMKNANDFDNDDDE